MAIDGLSWSEGVKARFLVLILDAPCHGLRYHSPHYGDKYPKGDPYGLNPEVQLRTLRDKLGVHVMVTEMPRSGLEKMLDVFSVRFTRTSHASKSHLASTDSSHTWLWFTTIGGVIVKLWVNDRRRTIKESSRRSSWKMNKPSRSSS